jgi:hypothetical protein
MHSHLTHHAFLPHTLPCFLQHRDQIEYANEKHAFNSKFKSFNNDKAGPARKRHSLPPENLKDADHIIAMQRSNSQSSEQEDNLDEINEHILRAMLEGSNGAGQLPYTQAGHILDAMFEFCKIARSADKPNGDLHSIDKLPHTFVMEGLQGMGRTTILCQLLEILKRTEFTKKNTIHGGGVELLCVAASPWQKGSLMRPLSVWGQLVDQLLEKEVDFEVQKAHTQEQLQKMEMKESSEFENSGDDDDESDDNDDDKGGSNRARPERVRVHKMESGDLSFLTPHLKSSMTSAVPAPVPAPAVPETKGWGHRSHFADKDSATATADKDPAATSPNPDPRPNATYRRKSDGMCGPLPPPPIDPPSPLPSALPLTDFGCTPPTQLHPAATVGPPPSGPPAALAPLPPPRSQTVTSIGGASTKNGSENGNDRALPPPELLPPPEILPPPEMLPPLPPRRRSEMGSNGSSTVPATPPPPPLNMAATNMPSNGSANPSTPSRRKVVYPFHHQMHQHHHRYYQPTPSTVSLLVIAAICILTL